MLRRERDDLSKALRFRFISLVGRPFFAWSDLAEHARKVTAWCAKRRERLIRAHIAAWRVGASAAKVSARVAVARHQYTTMLTGFKAWRKGFDYQTITVPRLHRQSFLLRLVLASWRFARRLRRLSEEVLPQRNVRKQRLFFSLWRRRLDRALKLSLAGLLLLKAMSQNKLRKALDRWPGRSEWRAAEAMRRIVAAKGPGRARLVENTGPSKDAEALRRLQRKKLRGGGEEEENDETVGDLKIAAAKYKSFLQRVALPVEQRAALFGFIFSADDLRAVRGLTDMLRAVLYAWADAAHTSVLLRGRARLVQFRHRALQKKDSFRFWAGRTTRTSHRMAQWIAKASVKPHSDWLRQQEEERRKLEVIFMERAGPKGDIDDFDLLDESVALQIGIKLSSSKGKGPAAAGLLSAVASDTHVKKILQRRERDALTKAVVNRLLGQAP